MKPYSERKRSGMFLAFAMFLLLVVAIVTQGTWISAVATVLAIAIGVFTVRYLGLPL